MEDFVVVTGYFYVGGSCEIIVGCKKWLRG